MDDKNKRGSEDAARVNINENYEVSYWTQRFGISEVELRKAVEEVGTAVSKIEEYLMSKE